MTENSVFHPDTERIGQIRAAVVDAKARGIVDKAVRREVVINAEGAVKKEIVSSELVTEFPSVAKADLRKEAPEVVDRAINKYLEVFPGKPEVPVLVDAIHAAAPNNTEVVLALREQGIDATYDEVALVREDASRNPELAQKIKEIRNSGFDAYTGAIAKKVHELSAATTITANQSRHTADANRYWWNRTEKPVKAREYSRSVRAAFYWATRRTLEEQGRLDEQEHLQEPFARISIHGMKNNDGIDFAIGAGRNPADPKFLEWFNTTLRQELTNVGLSIDGQTPNSELIGKDHHLANEYSGPGSLSVLRREPPSAQHPAFGDKFETVQLEISARVRNDKERREKVSSAIANVISQMPAYFESTNRSSEI